jgi:glyoxylate carboligase
MFSGWLRVSEDARVGITLVEEVKEELMRGFKKRIWEAWIASFQERSVKRKLFKLWLQKERATKLVKCFKSWSNYSRRKVIYSEMIDMKRQKSHRKILKKCFLLL